MRRRIQTGKIKLAYSPRFRATNGLVELTDNQRAERRHKARLARKARKRAA